MKDILITPVDLILTRFGCFGVTAMLSWGWLKLRLIDVDVDWSWGWLKLRLIKVEVDWSWGWLELRLIEVKVNLCYNLWYVFEVSLFRLITFILFYFLSWTFWFCGYSGHFELFWAILGCLVVDVRAEIYFWVLLI